MIFIHVLITIVSDLLMPYSYNENGLDISQTFHACEISVTIIM